MAEDGKGVKTAGKVPAAPVPGRYSSVVYFHGMGSQRRYEETSRLIDRLDRFLVRLPGGDSPLGFLRNIGAHVEPLRSGAEPDAKPASADIIGFIRTDFSGGKGAKASLVRFYEVYWAPVMADNKSAWGVAKWLFKQPLRPWRTLRAPWRERQRLRRAGLAELFERNRASADQIAQRDFTSLVGLYDDFEGLDAQRRFPGGHFEDFLSFVADKLKSDPQAAGRCDALARAWFAAYRRAELRSAAALAIITLTLILLAGGVLFGILVVLHSMLAIEPLAGVLTELGAKADWNTAAAIATALASLVGISKFLTDYLGDVEAWATYEETDVKYQARNKVLEQSLQTLTHVLCDPLCDRVTIVAHSLGTSVAQTPCSP